MPKRQQQELSEQALERITNVVRSLADDRVERGVELGRPMHCDSCNQEKAAAGSALYGEYRLCNDCLLDFTLALAKGGVDNVTEFMTKRTDDDQAAPPADYSSPREHRSALVKPKLMPRNEPAG